MIASWPELTHPDAFSANVECPVHVWATIALIAAVPSANAEEAAASSSVPKRLRPVSAHVADVLNEAAQRQPTPAADAKAPAGELAARQRVSAPEHDVPANGIVRLPDYIVREPRLPSREEVMSRHSLEQMAMEKYFGEETSLYRVLNMFSPAHLWRKIPLLGQHRFMIGQFSGPGSGPARGEYTTEDRAMAMYDFDQRRARWESLMGLLAPEERRRALNPESPPRPVPLK